MNRARPKTDESLSVSSFLTVEGLSVSYTGASEALRNVSLSLTRGESVAIIGPSGCGKSTLLQSVAGLLPPSSGSVKIDGNDVYQDSGNSVPKLGYVFQDHRLLPWRRVRENLRLVLDAAGVDAAEAETRIARHLGMLKIPEHAESWPLKMSGGQRQRASIARALAIQPELILMDEPFSTLDEATARKLREEVLEVSAELGLTLLLVTHSIREAVFMADRLVALSSGPGQVLFERPVEVSRPRRYDDPDLLALESDIMRDVMDLWG